MPFQCKGPIELRRPVGSLAERNRIDVARASIPVPIAKVNLKKTYTFASFEGKPKADNESVMRYMNYAGAMLRNVHWLTHELHLRDEIHQELSIRAWIAIELYDPSRGCPLHKWVVKLLVWHKAACSRAYFNRRRSEMSIDRTPQIRRHFDMVAEPVNETQDDAFSRLNVVSELIEEISNPRYRKAVIDHWFKRKTLKVIADEQFVSKQRIQQMIQAGLQQMRSAAECLSDDERKSIGILGLKL